MEEHPAVTALTTTLVVDKTKIAKFDAAEATAFFKGLYTSGKQVLIVESALGFFNTKGLISSLESGNPEWLLIAEHFGIPVSVADRVVLVRATAIRKEIADAVASIKPLYTLAIVPDGWSVGTHLQLRANLIMRTKPNAEGDETRYAIGPKTLLTVWNAAYKFWANLPNAQRTVHRVRAGGGYVETATIYTDRVAIGCQTVRRYELEQIALANSWAFG